MTSKIISELKRCTKCVMPETWVGVAFDDKGVCHLCREHEKEEKIDWEKRQEILKEILLKYKNYAKEHNSKYDCVVGYSGGKDSTYTLWALVKKYGMKPLVVTFDHGFKLSEEGEYNLMEIPKKLDCDHIRFTLGGDFRNALCYKGSEANGDFCWHCHNGIGAFPARISKQWGIPLQVWGEPTSKYREEEQDFEEQNEDHFKRAFQIGVVPEIVKPEGYNMDDFLPMTWPKEEFPLKAIYLGSYEIWDQRNHVDIITKELGWKHAKVEGTYVDWDKVDCPYEPVRDWQKFIKRGLGRTTFQASKDVREGLLTRDEALKLVEEYDGKRPKCLDNFLQETRMTEEEFNKLSIKHKVF